VVFQKENYSESFVTSILLSIPEGVKDSFLVIGGDGRYWNPEVVQLIAKIGAAYGVKKLLIGQDGILSTPAASHVIRKRKATGGILLTASHNAGGRLSTCLVWWETTDVHNQVQRMTSVSSTISRMEGLLQSQSQTRYTRPRRN
jgi:phosphomannomutase